MLLDSHVGQDLSAEGVGIAGGQTVAAWADGRGVFAAVRRGGGQFGSLQQLSRFPVINDDTRLLATDRRGDAIVAWQRSNRAGFNGSLFVSFKNAAGRFGAAHRIARNVAYADVSMDERGDATIVWKQVAAAGRPSGLDTVERRTDGRYGSIQEVAHGLVQTPSVAVDGSDQALLVWAAGSLSHPALLGAEREPGGRFGVPFTIVGGDQGGDSPQAAIDDAGEGFVAWEGPSDGASQGNPFRYVNVASVRVGVDATGPAVPLRSPLLANPADDLLELAVNPRGDALVSWRAYKRRTSSLAVVTARGHVGGEFGVPQAVGITYNGGASDAAIGPTGAAIVSWDSLTAPIRAAFAEDPSERFGPASALSPRRDNAAEPAVAIGSHGRAIVSWWDLGPSRPTSRSASRLYASLR